MTDTDAERLGHSTINEQTILDSQKNSLIEKYQLMTIGESHSFDIVISHWSSVTNFQQAEMFQFSLYLALDRVTSLLTRCTLSI
jgi:hypothetical protein